MGMRRAASNRRLKALIEQGLNIQILSECDFIELTRV